MSGEVSEIFDRLRGIRGSGAIDSIMLCELENQHAVMRKVLADIQATVEDFRIQIETVKTGLLSSELKNTEQLMSRGRLALHVSRLRRRMRAAEDILAVVENDRLGGTVVLSKFNLRSLKRRRSSAGSSVHTSSMSSGSSSSEAVELDLVVEPVL